MQDKLRKIRDYLRETAYQNEEHVRLSLVCRVLRELGWDIWNPREVNTEFAPNPKEDKKKADVALFIEQQLRVIIEVKAVGGINREGLDRVEAQVRDYNKDHTALFSIITDGQTWRFYHSQTGGEFHRKRFEIFDFSDDDLVKIEKTLSSFLTREKVRNGEAEAEARQYLQLTNEARAIHDCLPEADRRVLVPPYPTRPQSVVEILKEQGTVITEDAVKEHLARDNVTVERGQYPQTSMSVDTVTSRRYEGYSHVPKDLKHTRARGTIMGQTLKGWNPFLRKAVSVALDRGHAILFLKEKLPINIKGGDHVDNGFAPVPGHDVSIQAVDANKSHETLSLLAEILQCDIDMDITFNKNSPRAGETIKIQLSK